MKQFEYWPEDSDEIKYIYIGRAGYMSEPMPINDLIEYIHNYFGEDTNLDDISFEIEDIHLDHLTYDLYDPVDWGKFLILTKESKNG